MDNTLDKTGHGMEHKRADKAVEFRFAKPQDIPLILRFIRELADYEGMLDQVVATEELLNQWLFEKEKAEVILGMKDGETVGFALFFHNFSTFLGRAGIYLEDLYVRPEYRGQGIGTELLRAMMDALEREGVRQVSLSVQKGNPAVRLYRRVGFRIVRETEEEYIMVDRLGRASSGKEHAHAGQAGGRGGPIQPDRGQAGRAGDL